MFQFFRRKDKAVRIFLGALLVMVCVMMVVTLIPGLTGAGGSDETVLASVGSDRITSTELSRQLQQMMRNSRLPASMVPLYGPTILNQMVMEKATLLEARNLGLRVSEQEVAEQLRANPTLFPNGQFIGQDQYQNFIQQRYGLTITEFEEQYRRALLAEKLRNLVSSGAVVTDQEVAREYHRRNDKVKIDYVLLKTADMKAKVQISDAELNAYFQKNRTRYEVPEQRQFRVAFVDTGKLRESVAVTDDDLQKFYNDNKDRFRVDERVKVAHILFKTVSKTPEETEQIRKKAEEVRDKLVKGADFAQTAKQYSDDASTTPKGGDLGWITRGQTVPEFEKTAFSAEPGKISGVIKTVYGFHIMKIEERQKAHQQTLAEVRDQILPQVKAAKAQRVAEQEARKADDILRKNVGNLKAVADQLGVEVMDTGLIKRGDPVGAIGASPALHDALFSPTLKPNQTTDVTQVANGIVVAQLVKIVPAHPAELGEVRVNVENDLRNQKAAEMVQSRANEVAANARKDSDLKKAGVALGLTVAASEPFAADGTIKDVGAASSLPDVFHLNIGQVGGPANVTDGAVVYRVAERQTAPEDQLAQVRDSVRQELEQNKASMLFQIFTEQLRARLEKEGKLKVNQAALDRLTASFQ